jgi:hypothetical protein
MIIGIDYSPSITLAAHRTQNDTAARAVVLGVVVLFGPVPSFVPSFHIPMYGQKKRLVTQGLQR